MPPVRGTHAGMKTLSLAAVALIALSCAACHKPETREKIRQMENGSAVTNAAEPANEAQPQ